MPIDMHAAIRGCWIVLSPIYAILIVLMIIGIANGGSSVALQILVVLLLLHLVVTFTAYLGWPEGRRGYQELPSSGGEGVGRYEGPADASTHLLDPGVPQGVEVVPPYYQPTKSSPSAGAKGSDTSQDLLNLILSI